MCQKLLDSLPLKKSNRLLFAVQSKLTSVKSDKPLRSESVSCGGKVLCAGRSSEGDDGEVW